METDYESFIKESLEKDVIIYWIDACKAFGMDWREYPQISFTENTAKAGYASFKISESGIMSEYGITLNLEMAAESMENLAEFRNQVIPHEVCHLIANRFWRKDCAHGIEWQATMTKMGKNPARTHQMKVSECSNKTFEYKCPGCGQRFFFANAKHNRIQNGSARFCGVCNSVNRRLFFVKNHNEQVISADF